MTKLRNQVRKALEAAKPASSVSVILSGTVNASADRSVGWLPFPQLSVDTEKIFSSFYSSQGRQTSFPDHNADLIERLRASTENLATLEVS